MKIHNTIAAVLFLMGLAVAGCSSINPPMTAEEQEEYCKTQDARFQRPLSVECGDE